MIECTFELNGKPMSEFKMGAPKFPAFSGLKGHINKPASQCLPNVGPIPKGEYYIVDRESGGKLGWLRDRINGKNEWFALYANDKNIDDEAYCEMVKRGQFRLHPRGEMGISKGCITIDDWSDYHTVRALLKGTTTSKIPNTDIVYYGKVKVS